jgi:hypothetical protein
LRKGSPSMAHPFNVESLVSSNHQSLNAGPIF